MNLCVVIYLLGVALLACCKRCDNRRLYGCIEVEMTKPTKTGKAKL